MLNVKLLVHHVTGRLLKVNSGSAEHENPLLLWNTVAHTAFTEFNPDPHKFRHLPSLPLQNQL